MSTDNRKHRNGHLNATRLPETIIRTYDKRNSDDYVEKLKQIPWNVLEHNMLIIDNLENTKLEKLQILYLLNFIFP